MKESLDKKYQDVRRFVCAVSHIDRIRDLRNVHHCKGVFMRLAPVAEGQCRTSLLVI